MRLLATLFLTLLFASVSSAQQPPAQLSTVKSPLVKENSRVTVLGYHEFTKDGTATAMRMPTKKFRDQMQAIKNLGYNVITLDEFVAWKKGEKSLPDRSVLITIDDGWKSVYTDAYPILKEFKFPFTLFLYKNYVDGGGRALSSKMIREMQQNGASIGSHSVSHPYPSKVKEQRRLGPENYQKFLNAEFGTSKSFLEERFGSSILTYAYPGGYHTPEMFNIADTLGYQCLFTVLPGKVTRDSPNNTLPRYIILATHDSIFEKATSFSATATSSATLGGLPQSTEHPVTPVAGGTTGERLPLISADLSAIENLDSSSLVMRISGFGKVPAIFEAESKKFAWKVNRRLRKPTYDISVSWKLMGNENYEPSMSWSFILDRHAAYLPKTAPSLPPRKNNDSPTVSP